MKAMALQGSLKEFSPVELLQFPASGRKTCKIRVVSPVGEANLFFDKGVLVHAECRDKAGEDVLREIVGWKEGSFELQHGVVPQTRTIDKDLPLLILNALRQHDEQREADARRGKKKTLTPAYTVQAVLDQWIQGGALALHLSLMDAHGAKLAESTDQEHPPENVAELECMIAGLLDTYPRHGLRRIIVDDSIGVVAMTRVDDGRFLLMLAAPNTQPGAISLGLGRIAAQLAGLDSKK